MVTLSPAVFAVHDRAPIYFAIRASGFRRPAGMTSHSDGDATDNDRAAVVGTVATVGDGVSNGAATATDDTVIDGTVTDTGTVKKRNFHTGLEPVSRTKNSAQPTEFNAAADTADTVRYAQLFSLDTGSSPVWSVVVDGDADDGNRAIDTVTNPDDETNANDSDQSKIVIPAGRRNPDARTATQIKARSWTADDGGDSVTITRRRRCR